MKKQNQLKTWLLRLFWILHKSLVVRLRETFILSCQTCDSSVDNFLFAVYKADKYSFDLFKLELIFDDRESSFLWNTLKEILKSYFYW